VTVDLDLHTEFPDGTHTNTTTPGLTPGVWPKTVDIRGHFQLVGTDGRSLSVLDLGGMVQVAGIDVTNPDHLDEMAARLVGIANRLRGRKHP
jgi:hypothetical protein